MHHGTSALLLKWGSVSFGQKTEIRIFDILSFHKIFSMVVFDVEWEGQCGSQQGLKGAALPIAVSCNMVTLSVKASLISIIIVLLFFPC